MLQASFSAKSAVIAQQQRIDVISNNIANVSTNGFKSTGVTFKDMMYTTMSRPEDTQTANLQKGTGACIASMNYNFSQGTPVQTGQPLDFSLEGEGFFTVTDATGRTLYTRDGSFTVSAEADGRYLVTSQGHYVMDASGQRIRLPEGSLEALTVSPSGEMAFGTDAPFAVMNVANFRNPHGLAGAGNNCYIETVASGAPLEANAAISQGFTESSNVDMASEMVAMIRASRAFSLASRAITTADEMQATANNMRA